MVLTTGDVRPGHLPSSLIAAAVPVCPSSRSIPITVDRNAAITLGPLLMRTRELFLAKVGTPGAGCSRIASATVSNGPMLVPGALRTGHRTINRL